MYYLSAFNHTYRTPMGCHCQKTSPLVLGEMGQKTVLVISFVLASEEQWKTSINVYYGENERLNRCFLISDQP